MGGARPASRMRPVELIEDDDDGPWSSSRPARREAVVDRPATRDERRWWPWVGGALAAVVAAGALATGVTGRAAREHAEELARLPGVVRPLEGVPEPRWRAAAAGPAPVVAAGGAIVTVSRDDEGWVVRSLDPATGDARWQVPLVDPAGSGSDAVAVSCLGGSAPTAVLLCGWTDPVLTDGGPGESTTAAPPTQVRALDPVDGTERGAWRVDGALLGVVRHGDDVVVATALRDRHVLVERHDGTDGTVVWSWTSTWPLVESGGVRPEPELVGAGDVVALVARATAVLDARTGRVLEDGPPGRQILIAGLPDGGYATWASGLGGHLRDADGSVRAEVPSLPTAVVGDASLDALLLDAGNRVLAVSPTDGATAWTVPTSMNPVAVVDGAVVMASASSVGVVDGTDGRLLWEQDLVAELRSPPLTDGLHVLAAETDGDDGLALVARGLRDGVEAWRVALPSDLHDVVAVGGLVVARTWTEIVVLA